MSQDPQTVVLDPFHYHEALDRCHLVNCLIDDHLLFHPAVIRNAVVHTLLLEASGSIGQAYQYLCQQQDELMAESKA